MKLLLALLTLGATATAALAQPDLPRRANAPAAEDPERIVCELRTEPGSRVHRRRICMTEANWKVYRRESHHWTERMQDRRAR